MKKYQEFSTSSQNPEEENAYLHKLYHNYYSKEYKKKYASILEDKYQVVRADDKKQTNTLKKFTLAKYIAGVAACLLLLVLVRPFMIGNGEDIGKFVNRYSTTDIMQNREIKRGQADDDEFRIAAIQSYNKGDYQDALQSYNSVKVLDDEDKFWMAMANFYQKNYVVSENKFKGLLLTEDLKYRNELKWYYALSLLQNGKEKEAEVLLKEMRSWKSDEAQQLLNALK